MSDGASKLVSENTEWILRAILRLTPVDAGTTEGLAKIAISTPPPAKISRPEQIVKSVLRLLYPLVRPIVRPIAWRLRGFLLQPILPQLSLIHRQLADHVGSMNVLLHTVGSLKESVNERFLQLAYEQYLAWTASEHRIADLRRSLSEAKKEIEQSSATHLSNIEELLIRARDDVDKEISNLRETIRSTMFGHGITKFDSLYSDLQESFRGSRSCVKDRLQVYLNYLSAQPQSLSAKPVIDLGCGRGEWLELLTENKISCVGIEINERFIAENESRGFAVVKSGVVEYLARQPDESARAVSSFHLIEHLPFATFVEMIDQSLRVLSAGGFVVFESPNPENLVTAAHNFYLDPTHRKPIPPVTANFLLRARGFKRTEVIRLHENYSQAPDGLENEFLRNLLFGPQDFAVFGYK